MMPGPPPVQTTKRRSSLVELLRPIRQAAGEFPRGLVIDREPEGHLRGFDALSGPLRLGQRRPRRLLRAQPGRPHEDDCVLDVMALESDRAAPDTPRGCAARAHPCSAGNGCPHRPWVGDGRVGWSWPMGTPYLSSFRSLCETGLEADELGPRFFGIPPLFLLFLQEIISGRALLRGRKPGARAARRARKQRESDDCPSLTKGQIPRTLHLPALEYHFHREFVNEIAG